MFKGKIPGNWVDRETWNEILLCGKVVGRMASVGNVQGIREDTNWMSVADLNIVMREH